MEIIYEILFLVYLANKMRKSQLQKIKFSAEKTNFYKKINKINIVAYFSLILFEEMKREISFKVAKLIFNKTGFLKNREMLI